MDKYNVVKSPILNKYGVFDLNGQQLLPFKYDSIFHCFDDKYFAVGNLDTFSIDYLTDFSHRAEFYKRYLYGLVDINGQTIIDPFSEILWMTGNSIITSYDEIANIRNFAKQYLWNSRDGSIYLNDQIVFQSADNAVVKIWCNNIPGEICGGFKYLVYDTDINVIQEFISFKEVEEKLIYKKTPWRDLINIFPGIGFIVSPKWAAFKFTESNNHEGNRWWGILEINGTMYSPIKDYHLFNNHFMQIELKDGRVFIFNDKGHTIYESNSEVSIQTMGYCLDRIVINGMFILDTEGTKYQLETQFQHMKYYFTDGNGFIKVIDEPNVDMSLSPFSMPYKYFGLMDINGKEIVPVIFPRPEYSKSYVEAHGNPLSDHADISDAFDGQEDAYWNID